MPQVNKLRRIVIASVLKPVDESRMFEKIGLSLANTGQFEVHILAYPSTSPPETPENIFLHPHATPFHRISWLRILSPLKIARKIISLRPEIVILTTHELVWIGFICKLFLQCKIIYDVQENYLRNILYTKSFPFLIKPFIAGWVRIKEFLSRLFVSHYILAEKGYARELSFAKPSIILQNKLPKAIADAFSKISFSGFSNLIFSGTLSETTGVYKAIDIVKNLHTIDPLFSLTIIGYSPLAADFNKLQQLTGTYTFIRFLGKQQPVTHNAILDEIKRADFGIIYYPDNKSTVCSISTKLYEYLGLSLPILILHNTESHELVLSNEAGIVLSEYIDYNQLIRQMKAVNPKGSIQAELLWESEFPSLLRILNK